MSPRIRKNLLLVFTLVLTLAALSSCSTVGYYSQIVSGHSKIVVGKRQVEDVLADEGVKDSIKSRLKVAQLARDFGVEQLALPDNGSYTTYYDTGRRFVTWNVVAVEEFSFRPKKWCFPIAGCVSYRGYYAESDAQAYAEELAAEGYDVAVNGATAYSTLGWFKDPLALLFHELAHQQLYVANDSQFNESFASFVEREGMKKWQQQHTQKNPDKKTQGMVALIDAGKKRQQRFIELLGSTRDDLEVLYESGIDDQQMRAGKRQRFVQMQQEYADLKKEWNGYAGYDNWFSRELNNARLTSVATYNDYIPAFEALYAKSNHSFEEFYVAAQELSKLPASERRQVLDSLAETGDFSEQSAAKN